MTRVRPFFRRLAIAACVLLAPMLAHSLWDYIELRRLVAEIERLRQRSEPVTQIDSDRARSVLSGAARRASLSLAAASTLALEWRQPPAASETREWLAGGRSGDPRAFLEGLRRAVDDSGDALGLADKATALGFQGFEGGVDFSHRTAGLLALGQSTAARTLLLSLSGQGDAAVDSTMTGLAIRRALGERSLLTVSVHEIAAILSLSRPSDAALVRLQAALTANDASAAPTSELVAERARHLEELWRRFYGPSPTAPDRHTVPRSLLRPWITRGFVTTLRAWAEFIDAAKLPAPQRFEAVRATLERYGFAEPTLPASRRSWYFGPTAGYIRSILRGERQIVDRSSRLAIAIERYRVAHAGALPKTLDELAPTFIDRVPGDPLSTGPLRYRSTPDAYIVYSVGIDGVDDGGDLTSELKAVTERGWGQRAVRGKDIGIRVLVH